MLEKLNTIWHYPLVKLAGGGIVSVSQIALALLFLVVGLLVSAILARLMARYMLRARLGPDAANTIRKIVFYVLVVLVGITTLKLLHIPITAFAFLSGAIAIGLGFGAQSIINNFISGWILMSERPVRTGDYVETEGFQGVIEEIGNRSTRIRRIDGVHIVVPNSLMLERTLINWTLVDRDIRTTVRVGVQYGSPVEEVARLMEQAVNEHASIKKTPAPSVFFEDFGDNALIFDVYFWCQVGGERELRRIRSDIRFRITELFSQAGIVIAFPQRDVHLDADAALKIELVNND